MALYLVREDIMTLTRRKKKNPKTPRESCYEATTGACPMPHPTYAHSGRTETSAVHPVALHFPSIPPCVLSKVRKEVFLIKSIE